MWKGLLSGQHYPHDISKELYASFRDSYNKGTTIDIGLTGWIGYMASANGRFFEGGYSGITNTKIGTIRDYIKEAISNIEGQLPLMSDVLFYSGDYRDFPIPNNSILYCDIPYQGTKQYSTSLNFNHKDFWEYIKLRRAVYCESGFRCRVVFKIYLPIIS